ncbi:MAG: NAD-dependent protein deacylase [Planctomycetes bacterium]|nr:NAD-dependent protein deacylase [Planctomycetota bacterium]
MISEEQERACRQVAEMLRRAKSAVAFTGAGISTESGIPDFRSPNGIWANSTPVLYQEFLASSEARFEYWRQKSVAAYDFLNCQPNAGHRLLAQWESNGRLRGVITQNIDELHQRSGSQSVLELHGTALKVLCLNCQRTWEAEPWNARFRDEGKVPDCPDCGGMLKHATVSFGQQLPPEVLMTARQWSRQADVFLAAGSSLVVEPAASLPRVAQENGSSLIIVNRDPTPLDDQATLVIRGSIGEVFACVDRFRIAGGSAATDRPDP